MLLHKFRSLFWDAFHRPKLTSSRIEAIWEELEPLNDLLSGPLFAIYEKGECNYVFAKHPPFERIETPEDLTDWFQEVLHAYAQGLQSAIPANSEEEIKDLQVLDFQLDKKAELCEIAYAMYKERSGPH